MTTRSTVILIASGLVVLWLAAGCDRNIEPYDRDERSGQRDPTKTSSADSQRAVEADPQNSSAPGGGRVTPPGDATAPPIAGTISLASGLEERIPPGAVLFLIARKDVGGGLIAVVRVPSPSFPFDFSIGPENRMVQTVPFSGAMRLTARVDADGDPFSRNPGDMQGAATGTHVPGSRNVPVLIDVVL